MAKSGPLDIILGLEKAELAKAQATASIAAIKSHAASKYSDNIREITAADTSSDIKKLGVNAQLELAKIAAKF